MANEQHSGKQYDQRDSMSFLLLGGFFAMMALLVLIGTLWTVGRFHAMVVNLVSGLLLLSVGVGMLLFGRHLNRRDKSAGRKLP